MTDQRDGTSPPPAPGEHDQPAEGGRDEIERELDRGEPHPPATADAAMGAPASADTGSGSGTGSAADTGDGSRR